MNTQHTSNYTYESLRGGGISDSLVYLVGLVNSPDHKISDPLPARRILTYLFDIEEQAPHAARLVADQDSFCARYFPGGYHPQTPCMLTKGWSPISAMLEHWFEPLVLIRDEKRVYSTATGIWEPCSVGPVKGFESCRTCEELFWAVLNEATNRAKTRGMWVSLVASPGWSYDTKVNSLPRWAPEEVVKADRMIWKRKPEDSNE